MSGDQTPILQLLNVESSYGPIICCHFAFSF